MAEAGGLLLRVFTHPACGGCGAAVERAWRLSQAHPEIHLRTVSLEAAEGLAEAHAEGVKTIPTVILAASDRELRRWVGTPGAGELETAYAELAG